MAKTNFNIRWSPRASLMAQTVKNLPVVQETWVQSWVGKIPGEDNGYPLQYSCLENSMDRGDWQATLYGVTKSWTRLSDKHFPLNALEQSCSVCTFVMIKNGEGQHFKGSSVYWSFTRHSLSQLVAGLRHRVQFLQGWLTSTVQPLTVPYKRSLAPASLFIQMLM